MAGPGVILQGHLDFAVAEVLAGGIHKDNIPEDNIDIGMLLKEMSHCGQGSRKVLLITIQVAEDIAAGVAQTTINGVVHALVFLDKYLDPRILLKPIEGAVIRTGILNDMFDRNLLIGNRGDAELEPGGASVAGSND